MSGFVRFHCSWTIANLALKNGHTHSLKIITYALDILKNTLVQLIIYLVAAVLLDRFEYNILNIIDGCPWSKCIGFVFRNGQNIYIWIQFFFFHGSRILYIFVVYIILKNSSINWEAWFFSFFFVYFILQNSSINWEA